MIQEIHKPLPALLLGLTLAAGPVHAQEAAPSPPQHLVGDIGLGADLAPPLAHARSGNSGAIPYANVDVGPVFARIDSFGLKMLPAGYGSVELVTRVLEDGYTPASPQGWRDRRKSSLPIGIGTLQTTPVGAVFFNLYRDAGDSKGNLADLIYAAEIDMGPVALYPQVGSEWRSSAYVAYYYGVSPAEAGRSTFAVYRPGRADDLFGALLMEAKISGNWYLDANMRRTWLDTSVGRSPLVRRHTADTGLIAVSYRFE
jgi:outer membrane protein